MTKLHWGRAPRGGTRAVSSRLGVVGSSFSPEEGSRYSRECLLVASPCAKLRTCLTGSWPLATKEQACRSWVLRRRQPSQRKRGSLLDARVIGRVQSMLSWIVPTRRKNVRRPRGSRGHRSVSQLLPCPPPNFLNLNPAQSDAGPDLSRRSTG